MKRSFHHDQDIVTVDVFHQLKADKGFLPPSLPPFFINVHDPNREFIDLLDDSCIHQGLNPKLSKIELAFDFYTDDVHGLFGFLSSCLFMKQQRSKPKKQYETTFYANDVRESSRGLKVYIRRDRDGRRLVRLELTLKRQPLRRLGIHSLLHNIDSIDPLSFFSFMFLDDKRLEDYLRWKHRAVIDEIKSKGRDGGR